MAARTDMKNETSGKQRTWKWNQAPAGGAPAFASRVGLLGSQLGSKRLPSLSGTFPGVVALELPSDSPGGLIHLHDHGWLMAANRGKRFLPHPDTFVTDPARAVVRHTVNVSPAAV